ncbi:MAG: hypothetical protein HKN34_12490 [Gammaproteobacteria bacterium]|nr:hypothetical protein [Gammaproteobacteria bacterium]
MNSKLKSVLFLLIVTLASVSCSDNKLYETSYCALVDTSGTYADEKKNVVKIVKAGVVPEMVPGDSLFFVKIDSNSYAEDNLVTKLTLDYRPSKANSQKLALANTLDEFAEGKARSNQTDISGALMLCSDYLKSTKAGTQIMFVFSDMKEELPKGVVRKFESNEFDGINIAAMNVIKLNRDSSNPEVYRSRLKQWDKELIGSGAKSWNNLIDASKIQEFILAAK